MTTISLFRFPFPFSVSVSIFRFLRLQLPEIAAKVALSAGGLVSVDYDRAIYQLLCVKHSVYVYFTLIVKLFHVNSDSRLAVH